jgi:hypothetical protein
MRQVLSYRAWSIEQQRRYLESHSARQATHIVVDGANPIVGFQTLDRWSALPESMAHVGQAGTFLLPAWRGRGLARAL